MVRRGSKKEVDKIESVSVLRQHGVWLQRQDHVTVVSCVYISLSVCLSVCLRGADTHHTHTHTDRRADIQADVQQNEQIDSLSEITVVKFITDN